MRCTKYALRDLKPDWRELKSLASTIESMICAWKISMAPAWHLAVPIDGADEVWRCDIIEFFPDSFDSEDRPKFGTESAST